VFRLNRRLGERNGAVRFLDARNTRRLRSSVHGRSKPRFGRVLRGGNASRLNRQLHERSLINLGCSLDGRSTWSLERGLYGCNTPADSRIMSGLKCRLHGRKTSRLDGRLHGCGVSWFNVIHGRDTSMLRSVLGGENASLLDRRFQDRSPLNVVRCLHCPNLSRLGNNLYGGGTLWLRCALRGRHAL
jgi:hypothetical protein